MLRLIDPGSDPAWHDLPRGLRMAIRPMTSMHELAARSAAARQLAALTDGRDVMADLGIAHDAEDLTATPGMMLGMSELLAAIELGGLLIDAWEGPAHPDTGEPVPPERQWIARLFLLFPDVRTAFWQKAAAHLDLVSAEGNGSAPSSTGSPAGARATAATAKRSGKGARVASRGATDASAR